MVVCAATVFVIYAFVGRYSDHGCNDAMLQISNAIHGYLPIFAQRHLSASNPASKFRIPHIPRSLAIEMPPWAELPI
jgi:hypothetical protein